jgi:hypothetical protein
MTQPDTHFDVYLTIAGVCPVESSIGVGKRRQMNFLGAGRRR